MQNVNIICVWVESWRWLRTIEKQQLNGCSNFDSNSFKNCFDDIRGNVFECIKNLFSAYFHHLKIEYGVDDAPHCTSFASSYLFLRSVYRVGVGVLYIYIYDDMFAYLSKHYGRIQKKNAERKLLIQNVLL